MNTLHGAEYLLNQLQFCKKDLKISCNDGAVYINPLTMNFSYVGKFGQMVSRVILRHNASNDSVKKLIILHTYMDLYSTHNGGFTLTN